MTAVVDAFLEGLYSLPVSYGLIDPSMLQDHHLVAVTPSQ
jgi:hypothetical protein